VYADALTTVSKRYASEIQSSGEYGCGLEEVVRRRRNDLTGILNGVDYSIWNPLTDENISRRYDFSTIDFKIENKKALMAEMGLPFDAPTPLIGMVTRLATQKGIDLLMEAFDELMKLPVQLAVLGVGERQYHEFFERARKRYPDKVAADLSFNRRLAHVIEAGSDMFLMASRYEPCGLNQMYSLKYGTVPIVRATGGLDDTIQDADAADGRGTGFKFEHYHKSDLLAAVRRALDAFHDRKKWKKIIRNGMSKDFSWDTPARRYLHLYRSLARR
jgi:starch synthase